MNSARFFTAALVIFTLAGCCSGRNIVMDPCDPCAGMQRHKCGLSWLWPGSWFQGCGCHHCCGNNAYYGEMFDDCGCGAPHDMTYGASDCGCGAPHNMTYGGSSGGCGCSQTATGMPGMMSPGTETMMPSTPMGSPANSNSIPPIPPSQLSPETPSSANPDTTMMIPPSPSGGQPQTVSYEEFQRLPGTVISGPGAMPNSTAASPSNIVQTSAVAQPLKPPAMSVPMASRPMQRQPLWTPSKGY